MTETHEVPAPIDASTLPHISTTNAREVARLFDKAATIMESIEAVLSGEHKYEVVYRTAGMVSTTPVCIDVDKNDIIDLYQRKMAGLNEQLAAHGVQLVLEIRPSEKVTGPVKDDIDNELDTE